MSKRYFILLCALLSSLALDAANLVADGDFEQIRNGRLLKWQAMTRWKGKSTYRHVPGTVCIERPENDKGAGAYMSADIPVKAGKTYSLSADYKLVLESAGSIDLAVNWYDIDKKKISYTLIRRKKTAGSGRLSGQAAAPAGAAFARILLTMSGAGNVEYSKAVFDDGEVGRKESSGGSADNLLRNADFKTLENGLPAGWKTARWNGKSEYAMKDGCPLIRRTEGLEFAGAFISVPVKLDGAKTLVAAGEIYTSAVSTGADISIQFLDGKGKVVQYQLIGRVKGSRPWKKFSKMLPVPAEAVSVRMLLVLIGTGEAMFRNVLISGKMPEVPNPRVETSLILNGSFEEADLSPEFADCFTVKRGRARRITEAAHGSYALELAPGAEVAYGSERCGAIAVREKKKLFFGFFAGGHGTIEADLLFFDSENRKIGKIGTACAAGAGGYLRKEVTVTVPPGAAAASLILRNTGKTPVSVDAVHLGREPFRAEKAAVVPRFPVPAAAREDKFPTSSVRRIGGVPAWCIDGKIMDGAMFTLSFIRHNARKEWYDYVRRVLKVGQFPVVVIEVSITPENSGELYTLGTALRDIDVQVRSVLAEIPDARFILWTMLEPSRAFAVQYPDELLRCEDTTLQWKHSVPPYSYGSEIWGRRCAVRIAELLNEVSKKSYGDRIVGISPGMGRFGENNFGHALTVGGYSPYDFSPAMTNFFRKWLFAEYRGDVLAFASAWNAPGSNFTDAVVPGMMTRLDKDLATFYDVAKNRRTVDYIRCESFAILHRVLQQCEAAKKITGGRIFTFTQFAYFTGAMFQRELDYALKNPYLDAMGPAPPYINRGPGDDIVDHGPAASVHAHDKVWLFQADVRTHLASPHNWKYGRTADEAESVAVFLRDLGHYMSTGTKPYYMTFEKWYDSPKMMELVGKFNRFFQLADRFPRRQAAQIAVVIDPVSLAVGHEYSYVRRIMPPQQSTLEYNRTFEWHKLGAPYDFYLLDDLLAQKDLSRYKAVIFAANYCVSESQRRAIGEKLRKDGRFLIWFYAPGIFDKQGSRLFFAEGNAAVSGFSFEYDRSPGSLEITLPDGRIFGKFTTEIYGGFTTPDKPRKVRPETFRPRLIVKEAPGVEILGRYADGKNAFARRKGAEHTDIFWGSSALNKEVLIPLLKEAGVHLYTDRPAVVYANENFISVHSGEAGEMTLTLPEKAEVIYDLYEEKVLARDTAKLLLPMGKNRSVLLYCGKAAELNAALVDIDARARRRAEKNEAEKPRYAYALAEIRNLAKPADPAGTYPVETDGTIRHWQLLGAFPGYTGSGYGYETDFIGETAFRGEFGKTYEAEFRKVPGNAAENQAWTKKGTGSGKFTLKWQPLVLSSGRITRIYEETSAFPFYEYITYYAACFVVSDREREVILSVGSDDGEKSFLDGKPVTAKRAVSRRLQMDSEQGVVTLKPGKNLLLLKICQGSGGVGHVVRFLEPATGKPVTDLHVTLQ